MRAFRVNIAGLSNNVHTYHFDVDDSFFVHYGTGVVSEGSFDVGVTLDKRETFIDARFEIKGAARLVCDRSLDLFQHPITVDKHIVFKFGNADEELSDEIIMIHRDADSLELGQYIYEFIALAVPIKKLHPRYQGEPDDDTEGKIIYSSSETTDGEDDDNIDPRWEKLKKLK
mgnify:CR=1 FL=1